MLDDSFENRRHAGARAANRGQNVTNRGLIFEALCPLARGRLELRLPLLQVVEQPCVLDGDECLIGESLDKLDLTLAVRLNPSSE